MTDTLIKTSVIYYIKDFLDYFCQQRKMEVRNIREAVKTPFVNLAGSFVSEFKSCSQAFGVCVIKYCR